MQVPDFMVYYPPMCMLDTVRAKRDEIYALAQKHKAERPWGFGLCGVKGDSDDADGS